MPNRTQEERLKTLFKYFVDVVRINLFITTASGKSVITPERNPYGWTLLANASDIKNKFQKSGDLLEYIDEFQLHHFAFPIKLGYVVLGPLIMNKRLERQQYIELAVRAAKDPEQILDALQEIRVVSQNQLKSILDLIAEAKDFFLGEEPTAMQAVTEQKSLQALNLTLRTLLEEALALTKAKSGSVMLYNPQRGLSVQVSKGINPQFAAKKPIKIGEGISGYALQENRTFILSDRISDNRMASLLKRKEIKQSIVMPFISKNGIKGVLNLNIEESKPQLNEEDEIIKNLTKMTISAFEISQK